MGFLDAEALIAERLESRVGAASWTGFSAPRVFKAADAANVADQSQLSPAYFVVLESYTPTQLAGGSRGGKQQIEQLWSIYVSVRNAGQQGTAQGVRNQMAPMIDVALAALLGFEPSAGFSPLEMAPGPGPDYSDAGYAYAQLNFKTRLHASGT